jgi:glycosyltransferase involved in cell wall biosynthesis
VRSPQPQVSVLMPVGPNAPFLEQALLSVCAQTFAGWELVALLDGASRTNGDVLRRVVPPAKLRLVERTNPVGIAAAHHAALGACRGELVAVMHSDDICHPDRLRCQKDFLEDHPEVVALGSAAHIIDETGRRRYVRRVSSGVDLRRRLLLRNQLIHPSVMFRREATRRVGGYNPGIPGAEDFELWLRLSAIGPLVNLPDPLLEYRVWTGQFSRIVTFGPVLPELLVARHAAAVSVGIPPWLASAAHQMWRFGQSRTAHRFLDCVRAARGRLSSPKWPVGRP